MRVGLDVSHHARISQRGGEKFFYLTSSFIGKVLRRCFANCLERIVQAFFTDAVRSSSRSRNCA